MISPGPTSWYGLIRKLHALLRPSSLDQELADELNSHLDLQTRKYVAQGMSEESARRLARLEFGSVEKAREECRDEDRWAALHAAGRNFVYALRTLRMHPGFTVVAIAILAMGMGSTLAVFQLLDALLLRPLPIRHAGELVRIATAGREGSLGSLPTTFLDTLRRTPEFRSVCGFDTRYPGVEVRGSITSVGTLAFSGDCFSTLGVGVQLGRSLTPDDDHAEAEPSAVITDAFWRRVFDARPEALGQRIRMDGQTYTVVGVAEPGFSGLLVGFPAGLIIPARQQYSQPLPNGNRPNLVYRCQEEDGGLSTSDWHIVLKISRAM